MTPMKMVQAFPFGFFLKDLWQVNQRTAINNFVKFKRKVDTENAEIYFYCKLLNWKNKSCTKATLPF